MEDYKNGEIEGLQLSTRDMGFIIAGLGNLIEKHEDIDTEGVIECKRLRDSFIKQFLKTVGISVRHLDELKEILDNED